MNDKVIGIVGGMGPEATDNLFKKIIEKTTVTKDQDHFRVIIDNNPKIPDRTAAILRGGESPVPELVKTAKNLERAGADVLCMPCMTAHYFIEEVSENVGVEFANAFVELNEYILKNYPNVKNVGVLCTSGSRKVGIYDRYLPKFNIMYPSMDIQENCVMEAIYGVGGIKNGVTTGMPVENIKKGAVYLIENGADIVIAGCTEIGLVSGKVDTGSDVIIIDPMDVLAEALVR